MAERAAAVGRGAGRGGAAGEGSGRVRAGAEAGGEGSEAGGHAAQPRTDQHDQRPGQPAAADPRRDRPAQQVDDAGELCGRGEGGEEARTK